MRSPRTPTYTPSSSSFFTTPPFDPSRVFLQLSPTKSVEQIQPPQKPLVWIWQCHLCRTRYPLGATRRCLVDGHFYCSGEMDRPNLKKNKKGQSCSSEFDYIGWKSIEQWKRKMRKSGRFTIAREPVGCEKCEFPSECRYESHNVPCKDINSLDMTEVGSSTLSASISPTPGDRLSRFYKNDSVTFDSILAGPRLETSKAWQSQVTDYYKPDRKVQAHAGRFSTSAVLREVMKSAEGRSGAHNLLSPIQEEFAMGDEDSPDTEDWTPESGSRPTAT